jgi:hypothetical protein
LDCCAKQKVSARESKSLGTTAAKHVQVAEVLDRDDILTIKDILLEPLPPTNPDLDADSEIEGISNPGVILQFLFDSSQGSRSTSPYISGNIESDQKRLIECAPSTHIHQRSHRASSIPRSGSSKLYESLSIKGPSLSTTKSVVPRIPRPPTSNRRRLVQVFLEFHRETVTYAHYFLFYDYPQLCQKLLFSMSDRFDSLRYAIAAFSALIYSVKIDLTAREKAFLLCDCVAGIAFVPREVPKRY